jgi:hypothetical protein
MNFSLERATTAARVALLGGMMFAGQATAALVYQTDFHLDTLSESALADDGWLVFGNVYPNWPACDGYLYSYGPFGAPNGGPGFSSLVMDQDNILLNVYSDYNNGDHANGACIEANVFQEVAAFDAADAGTYEFKFTTQIPPESGADAAVSTYGFVKLLDPNNNFNTDIFLQVDTATAGEKMIEVTLDESAGGKILQWGFASVASDYLDSGRWYDDVSFAPAAAPPPPEPPEPPPPEPPPETDDSVANVPASDTWALLMLLTLVSGMAMVHLNRKV